MEYPANKNEVKIAKNVYEHMKKHYLYMERRKDNKNCIPDSVALEDRQEETDMTNKILAEIEKLLKVKKLLSDQELATKVDLKSRRVLEKGYKRPGFDVVHKNKPLHEIKTRE